MQFEINKFRGRGARIQYVLLMGFYRFAFVNRWLYGIICRSLARFFSPQNAVLVDLGKNRAYWIYLNDGYWTRFFLYHRSYEPEVKSVLDAAAGNTTLFCDLGANAGLWSVYGSSLFEKVLAVEASQVTFERLQENVSHLPHVEAHHAAVYEKSGEVVRFVNVHNSHASAHVANSAETYPIDRMEEVETVCIDSIAAKDVPALIKLDVEGAEIDAINGAVRAIRDGSVIIYEDHGSDASSEVSRHLMGLPLVSIYSLEKTASPVTNAKALSKIKVDPYTGYNFLAGRQDSDLLKTIIENFTNGEAER